MEMELVIRTGLAALLFALVFAVGGPTRPVARLVHSKRGLLSFGAGMSAAYMFVHVMPELHATREVINEFNPNLPWEGMIVYFLALVGFLVFYALGHLRRKTGDEAGSEAVGMVEGYRLQLGGFAAYVWLLGYLLVRSFDESEASVLLFAVAIGLHLLSLDRSLTKEFGERYARRGRYLLAAMGPLGWASALLVNLPNIVSALLVAFISGAVIVNSTITELPHKEGGRLVPFLLGGLIYGLVLLPFG
jgi:hypothetical protein